MPDIWLNVDGNLTEVPVNIMPLIDDTDFKTREVTVAYNQAGMDLVWNFVDILGQFSQTAVTPTTGGVHDWAHQGDAMYTIEIPNSNPPGDIKNDAEGFGWFTGVCTGVLPWRGPVIGFRALSLNQLLITSAYSATRGLAGTALPNAVADAAGGLPISDAGGLDLDAKLSGSPLAQGAGYVGDFLKNGTVEFTWSTMDRTGAAVTPSTAGTIKVYKSTGTTEIQVPSGITDTRSFSGTTGNHQCVIDLSATTSYVERENYMVVLEGAVIDTKTVNVTLATFSIKNRYQGKKFIKDG